MTKQELAKQLVAKKGLTMKQALAAIDGFSEAVISSLAFGKGVFLRGFGTFKVMQRAARRGRDIAHNTLVDIPAHKIVKFIPSKQLKDVVK